MMTTENLRSTNLTVAAIVSVIALNAFIYNPWTKFPYTFVIIIAAALLISFAQFKSLAELGFKTNYSFKKILLVSFFLFVIVEIFVDFFLQPFITWVTNEPQDYGAFEVLKGNSLMYKKYFFYTWISAAFGEEIFFRGFLFQQFKLMLPEFKYKLALIVLLSSVLFALPHFYLGLSGVIFTFAFGIIFSLIYIKCHYNLWIPIIVHGIVDSIFITLAYTDNMWYYEWVNNFFSSL